MNTRYLILALAIVLGSASYAEEDDWLGADHYRNSVGIRVGLDNGSGQVLGVDADLVLPYYALLSLGISRSSDEGNSDDFDSDTIFVALSTDPLAQWFGQVSYQQSGNDQLLETEDWQLSIGYYPGDWRVELGVIDREITSYFNPYLVRLGLLNSSSIDLQSDGYSVNIDYFGDVWGVALASQYMEYQQDLDLLQSNRRLRILLGQQTLSQMSTLTQWQADMQAYYQLSASSQFAVGLVRYKAIVGGELDSTVYTTLNQKLSDDLTLVAMLAHSSTDALTYGELSMYYYW